MLVEINKTNLDKLCVQLARKLEKGCDEGAKVVRANTPIDTKRLWESTRADTPVKTRYHIKCRIIAGGLKLYGVTRETDIKKEVDYAIYVEYRYNYIRSSLKQIKRVLIESLKNSQIIN